MRYDAGHVIHPPSYRRPVFTNRFYRQQPVRSAWKNKNPKKYYGGSYLPFRVSGRTVAELWTDGVFADQQCSRPSLAVVGLEKIKYHRSKKIHGRSPKPLAIRCSKLRALQPADPLEDPYLVGLIIGLAQANRQYDPLQSKVSQAENTQPTKPESITTGIKVQLIILPEAHGTADDGQYDNLYDSLYVYTATMSDEFLDRFDFPDRVPQQECSVKVSYRRIAIDEPGATAQTLRAALGWEPGDEEEVELERTTWN